MVIQNKSEKLRFSIVGVLNTVVDFTVLLLLRSIGVPSVIANYPSSSLAVIVSFLANKHYTFRAKGSNLRREIILFLIVTLSCAWILQPITIYLVELALAQTHLSSVYMAAIAKVAATIVTLVWNYLLYSRVVFKMEDREQQ